MSDMSQVYNIYTAPRKFDSLSEFKNRYHKGLEKDVVGKIGDLKIDEDKTMYFHGEKVLSSHSFINNLSNHLGYPTKMYQSKLDVAHHIENLNYLISEFSNDDITLRLDKDLVTGLYTGSKTAPYFYDVADYLSTVNLDHKNTDTHITVYNNKAIFCLASDQHSGLDNDPSRIDLYTEVYYAYNPGSSIGLRLKRFACDNSTVVRFGNSTVRSGTTPEMSLENIRNAIPNLQDMPGLLKPTYRKLVDHKMDTSEFQELRNITRNILGVRNETNILSSYYKKEGNEVILDNKEIQSKTPYDVFNDVTYRAKRLELAESIQEDASAAAGDIFRKYMLN